MTDLLSGPDLAALFVKILSTAFLVVAVAWSVKALGPRIGGLLAGLPITVGPGLYFLAVQNGPGFVAQSATYSLLSLSATQVFLLAYILAARKLPPLGCISGAFIAWACSAWLVHQIRPSIPAALLLFILVSLLCFAASKSAQAQGQKKEGMRRDTSLALRALLAGVLVAAITTAGHELGPALAGLLLPYPITYSVVAVTVHQQLGRSMVMTTLRSALLGTTATAGFCSLLGTLILGHGLVFSFMLAIAAAMLISLGMFLAPRTAALRHR